MLQITDSDLSFLKRYSNTKKHSLQSKKRCFNLICDLLFRGLFGCYQIQSFRQLKDTLKSDKNEPNQVIYKILSTDPEINCSVKWRSEERRLTNLLQEYFKNQVELEDTHEFQWILFNYLDKFIDYNIIRELHFPNNSYLLSPKGAERSEEEEVFSQFLHQYIDNLVKKNPLLKNNRSLEYAGIAIWEKEKHAILWGDKGGNAKIRAYHLYRKIKRFEKVLKPILPIIH